VFKVYDLNMNLKPFPEGVRPLDIFIHSIEKEKIAELMESVPGSISKGYTKRNRMIEVYLRIDSVDTIDYRMIRNELYRFFTIDDVFYVVEEYRRGIRYKVSNLLPFIPDRINQRVATVRFPLEIDGLPFGESIGTTKIIDERGTLSDDEIWGFGMGLIDDPESRKYTHEGTSFKTYNAGDLKVIPYHQDLKITISNVTGSTSFIELRNKTNNTRFRTTQAVSNNQTIVIDGGNVTSNNLAYLRYTTKEFIELSPGWNEFEITGANSAKVQFDFRFYYV
jgi:Phage tail protein